MTKQECAVIMAYTGICMLQGDDLTYYYNYVSELLGIDASAYDFVKYEKQIKYKAENDFKNLCFTAVDVDLKQNCIWREYCEKDKTFDFKECFKCADYKKQ